MSELIKAREEIEETDRQMAALFIKRMRCAASIAAYKKSNGIPILDREREQELIKKNEGYIEEEGTPEQIFQHPKCERLQQFLKSVL